MNEMEKCSQVGKLPHEILALQRLRLRAIEAHSSQDAATINHCCALYFERFAAFHKGSLPFKPSLYDSRWAFAFALYWLTDTYMISSADLALQAWQNGDSVDEFEDFLLLVISLVKLPLLDPINVGKKVDGISVSWLSSSSSQEEDCLLIQLCTELTFTRDPWNSSWLNFIDRSIKEISITWKENLERTKNRLLSKLFENVPLLTL